MIVPSFDPLVVAFASLLLKATMVIALAFVVHAVSARWLSAATRHLVTVLAVAMLLALPVLTLMLPGWAVPVPTAARRAAADGPLHLRQGFGQVGERALPDEADGGLGDWALANGRELPTATVAPVARVPWSVVFLAIYAAGVVVMAAHLVAHRQRVHRIGRDAREVTDAAWLALFDEGRHTLGIRGEVRLVRSLHGAMPMTYGTRRPAILLPATADTWDADRRRAVILHELAHVARRDCLAQWAACAMRAVYWCHPGAWWLVARLRLDREFACDDLVLAAGAPPREYARHLLDIAYTFGGGRAPALAVRMARRSQIEGRLQALLDASRDRRRPSTLARRATTAGAFAVLLPLASLTSPLPGAIDDDAPRVAAATAVDEGQPAAPSGQRPPAAAVPRVRARIAPVAALAALASPAPTVSPLPALTAAFQASTSAQTTPAETGGCTWEVGRGKENQLHLSMRQGRSHTGRSLPLATLEGLTDAQLTTGGPVHFVLRRDAGTFTFDGTARGGVAAGVCTFAASPTFGAELARRGVSGLTPDDQLQLARHDVGLALVDELKTQKYATPSVADLVKAGQHGVHVEYLRGMGALGYATGTLAPLITLRDHGVTPDYAKALASLGYAKLPIDQLQRARDHGVTPDYVKGMRDAGHGVLTLEQLITTRDHGVTPEFGQALAAAGYANVPLDQLVRTRDHGVTADYIRDMKALGMGGPLEELVRARDHGVTPDYVRALGELGYKGLPLEALIRMRDHGVTAAYVTDIQGLGYSSLSQDDIVNLRDHGLTVERIRQANARAGRRLTVAELHDAATGRTH